MQKISNGCIGPHQLSDAVDIREIEETCGEQAFLKRSTFKTRKKRKGMEKERKSKTSFYFKFVLEMYQHRFYYISLLGMGELRKPAESRHFSKGQPTKQEKRKREWKRKKS